MSRNFVKEFLAENHLEYDEHFTINNYKPEYYFSSQTQSLIKVLIDEEIVDDSMFMALLVGRVKVVKKPWRPNPHSDFYTIGPDGEIIRNNMFAPAFDISDYFCDRYNNIYATEDAAIADRPRVMRDVYGKEWKE